MGPALSPGAVAQEMAACAVLGGVLGAARAVLPTRGRAAFLPDMLFVGAVLMALQSYAVSQSQAGQLRGYMALAAFCAAGAVQAALRPLFAAAEAFAGKLLLGPVRLAARCIAPWKAACTAACSGRRFTAPGAPAGRAAARPAEKGAQTTPQRKKNCKKEQKELAKPAPCVV